MILLKTPPLFFFTSSARIRFTFFLKTLKSFSIPSENNVLLLLYICLAMCFTCSPFCFAFLSDRIWIIDSLRFIQSNVYTFSVLNDFALQKWQKDLVFFSFFSLIRLNLRSPVKNAWTENALNNEHLVIIDKYHEKYNNWISYYISLPF